MSLRSQRPVPAATVPTPVAIPAGEATPHANLFPDTIPAGPDPLANHVVDDPGFADVDVEEIRRQRALEARKKNKLNDAFSSSSSLAKMEEEEYQKEKTRVRNVGYFSGDTLFGFDGRIPRKKFWVSSILFGLANSAITFVLLLVYGLILFLLDIDLPKPQPDRIMNDLTLVAPIFFIMFVSALLGGWVGIALHVKRYHDLGRAGTRLLIGLIPLVGGIWVLVECGFFAGTPGKNKYGPDPLAISTNPSQRPENKGN